MAPRALRAEDRAPRRHDDALRLAPSGVRARDRRAWRPATRRLHHGARRDVAPGLATLVLYDRAAGQIDLQQAAPDGGLSLLKTLTGVRTTWTAIVGLAVTASPFDDLLFYERSTGSAELYSADGTGALALVQSYSGWRTTWAAIVPGRFEPGAAGGLFFYDRSTGSGELHSSTPRAT